MLLKIYEKLVERKIKKVPKHIVIVTDRLADGFLKFLAWCSEFGIEEVTVCGKVNPAMLKGFKVRIINGDAVMEFNGSKPLVNILNFSGKEEIVSAVRKIAKMVAEGKINAEDLNEQIFEKFLAIKSQPDMIVKAGLDIPDFLIWQSIYAEMYFADIDWENFRYVDFLRMLREYQRRERRYGR